LFLFFFSFLFSKYISFQDLLKFLPDNYVFYGKINKNFNVKVPDNLHFDVLKVFRDLHYCFYVKGNLTYVYDCNLVKRYSICPSQLPDDIDFSKFCSSYIFNRVDCLLVCSFLDFNSYLTFNVYYRSIIKKPNMDFIQTTDK